MKYKDLIQFEPIESVIQLREADAKERAFDLVKTYVISERMAEQLEELVLPGLRLDHLHDSKGIFIVGNYGTGKSHLMSVLSAVAEYPEAVEAIRNSSIREKAGAIAGKFQVLRIEIGSTKMSLRDIIFTELETYLDAIGVDCHFPEADKVVSNKTVFAEMMKALEATHPDQGLLIVVDELLDFLKSRDQQAIMLDLNFLREIGEACRTSCLRFMAGIQEALFDNPHFQFVASSLRRVKDRFEQLRIVREDIAYVVAERLLKKDERQKALIREHLEQFTRLYGSMAERMEEFVSLFPVHPAYLETFEQIYVVEKRQILKTISAAMKKLLREDVPENLPGLIAYDSYWEDLKGDSSLRSIPDVRDVVDRSQVLENRLIRSFVRPQYQDPALRIIHALSVHRLTTLDVRSPIGVTAEELRDDLCLWVKDLPEEDSEFLKATVETILDAIRRTVNGQFISQNAENGQYYIDIDKDIDYNAKIEERAETLSENQLDCYYFEALARAMECRDVTYVSGYRIWEHQLEWREHCVTRKGYLFFGAPNERSTAQPPRDFYLYFLQPLAPPHFEDEKKRDEVFFRLINWDEELLEGIKLFAGAREMANTTSGNAQQIYNEAANNHLKEIVKWLKENISTAFEVTYQGATQKFAECIKGRLTTSTSIRDLVNAAGAACLSPYFSDQSPEYPRFSALITDENRAQAAKEAVKWIAGTIQTRQGANVLDALEMLDGNKLKPKQSKYVRHMLALLAKKQKGEVLNREEIISGFSGVEYEPKYRLEPEWVVVLLAGLVYSGDIILSITGNKIDASNIQDLTRVSVKDLVDFRHIEHPKAPPLDVLQMLFEVFSLPPGLVRDEANRSDAVKQLQAKVLEVLDQTVEVERQFSQGLLLFGIPLIAEQEEEKYRKTLAKFKDFLEHLKVYNTPGKLRNFEYRDSDIKQVEAGYRILKGIQGLIALLGELSPLAAYLGNAETVLPQSDQWLSRFKDEQQEVLAEIRKAESHSKTELRRSLMQRLTALKNDYIKTYLNLHKKARLGINEDERKKKLLGDKQLEQLKKLAGIDLIMPKAKLLDFQNRLAGLKTCFGLTGDNLRKRPVCPHCSFKPSQEPTGVPARAVLDGLSEELEKLHRDCTESLVANLEDPSVKQTIGYLKPAHRDLLEKVVSKRALPDEIDSEFVSAVREVFAGIQPIKISMQDFRSFLQEKGSTYTVGEFRKCFEEYVKSLIRGKDPDKVRIIAE